MGLCSGKNIKSTMSYSLIIRPQAEIDISDAYDWYNSRLSNLGSEFIDSLDDTFNSMLNGPESYAIVYKNIRRALVHRFPYAVYYIQEESRLIVLAVFHFRRDPKLWQTRK